MSITIEAKNILQKLEISPNHFLYFNLLFIGENALDFGYNSKHTQEILEEVITDFGATA